MFKRESEQPVKISFEENKEKRKKRSLRERLSNIPLRRRVEAVILAVVTVMASLSIDWSSLVARAAGQGTLPSGQRISQIFTPDPESKYTTLNSATIKVKTPKAATSVNYSWQLYQNIKEEDDPETGVKVDGASGSGIASNTNAGDFVPITADLSQLESKVVLNGDETAAVVFTLSTTYRYNIYYETEGAQSEEHLVYIDDDWTGKDSGSCITYDKTNSGSLETVNLSEDPEPIYLTEGQSYTFSGISWTPGYQRELTLTENSDLIQDDLLYPTFKVAGEVGRGGKTTVTVGGDGVKAANVEVNVVGFELQGPNVEDRSVFPYKGEPYTADKLIKAYCGEEIDKITENFQASYSGTRYDGTRVTSALDAGNYTMTIRGKGIYSNIVCTKKFVIEPRALEKSMFKNSVATVRNGVIESITDGQFITDGQSGSKSLVYKRYENDFDAAFDAEIKSTTPEPSKVTYSIKIKGINNFKDGDEPITLPAEETSGISIASVVDHIKIVDESKTYDGTGQDLTVKLYNSKDEDITNYFTEGTHYNIKYSGVKRSSGEPVSGVDQIVDAGEYKATVEGIGIYSGSITTADPYILKPISLKQGEVTVTLKENAFEYSDSLVVSPEIVSVRYTVKDWPLAAGTDYVLKNEAYSPQVGSHNVTILGRGNYEGAATAEYSVFPSLLTAVVSLDREVPNGTMKAEKTDEWDYVWSDRKTYEYKGSAFTPEITAKIGDETLTTTPSNEVPYMRKGEGNNNINVSKDGNKAYFILTLPAKYAEKKIKVEFEITAKSISDAFKLKESGKTKPYDYGEKVTLTNNDYEMIVDGTTLKENTDYKLKYENNENAGTANVIAEGMGNYTGTSSKTFTITPVSIDDPAISISIKTQKLNTSGTEVNPNDVAITATFTDGDGKVITKTPFTSDDFTLSGYKNNTSAWESGEGDGKEPKVTITGKRNLTGTIEKGFQIAKELLSDLGLTWKLVGTSVSGKLGSPGTIDTGYVVDFSQNLSSMSIKLYYSDGRTKFESANYYRSVSEIHPGTNTITVGGKGNYKGDEYKFTYEVRQLDIRDCEVTQTDDGSVSELPKFTLTYNGNTLTPVNDYETNLEEVVEKVGGKYKLKDYTVTINGVGNYTGTKTATIHIGKPFDKDHVFITMYGPAGTTTTVNGENRLTYFGNNDPYFILTSNKTDSSKKIQGPKYEEGAYDDTGDYNITFEPSEPDEKHKVGTTVKVTFKAKEGDTWYNPDSNGIEYTYTVVPGSPIEGTGYGVIGSMLSVYTMRDDGTPGSESKIDERIKFPGMTGWQNEIILTRSSAQSSAPLVYKYTTEPADPNLWISYDPVASARVSQSQEAGIPALGDGISYAAPFECPFSNIFDFKQGDKISATDKDKRIIVTPTSGSWLRTTNNNKEAEIRVEYAFTDASLSDATIAPEKATYTYSGKAAAVSYNVTIGTTALDPKTDYELVGYYKYPESGDAYEAIEAAKADKSLIGEKLSGFGSTVTPQDVGRYVLVIKAKDGSHYKDYNIAEFSIESPNNFSSVTTAGGLSVKYKGAADPAVPTADMLKDKLTVIGVNGEKLDLSGNDSTDGYKIVLDAEQMNKPRTDAWVWVKGTGNYAGCEEKVFYSIVADITPNESPDFSKTEPYTTLANYTSENSCLKLTLKNDGDNGLPFIDETTRFDLSKLTLSDGSVTLDRDCLTIDVFGLNGSDNDLKSIGKKWIKVSGATGKPVTGDRGYYVEVFADISTADVTLQVDGKDVDPTQIPYTGQSMIVNPVVKFRGKILFENTDYTIDGSKSYEKVGTYTASMTVKGNHEGGVVGKYYAGTKSIPFTIVYDLSKDGVQIKYIKDTTNKLLSEMSFPYTGESIGGKIGNFVKVIVKNGSYKELKPGPNEDYILEFEKDREPGVASATIRPVSTKSMNSQTVYFSIGGNTLNGSNCKIEWRDLETVNNYVYDGTAKEPDVIVSYRENTEEEWTELRKDYDYEVYYSNNINATTDTTTDTSKAIVTVTGINGRFNSSVKKEFGIKPKSLDDVTVEFKDIPFGGKNAGGRLPGKAVITVKDGDKTLKEGTDYTVKYGDGDGEDAATYLKKNPGEKYDITVTGMGNYTGDVVGHPVQLYGNLEGSNIVIASPLTSEYDGEEVALSPVIKNGDWTLVEGTDYTIEIQEKILDAKTYSITITAVSGGDYDNNGAGSSRTFSYTVTPRPINGNIGDSEVTLYDPATGNSATNFKWTGDQIKPWVRVEDKGIPGHYWTDKNGSTEGPMKDFEVTYGDNKTAGPSNGTVTITAKSGSNYTGSIKKTFSIGTDIANATLSYDKTSAEYDGTPKNQNITVSYNGETLTPGTAYESPVKYTWKGGETSTPSAVGEYTPVIKGKPEGGFYGEKTGALFRITAKNKTGDVEIWFKSKDREVDAGNYICHYNTKQQKPSIVVYDTSDGGKVALSEGTDYEVSYGNNVNAGPGYVYVTLKGNYTGSAQEIFTILPFDISTMTLSFTEGEGGVIRNISESSFPYVPLFKLTGIDDDGASFEVNYTDSRLKQYLVIPDESKAKKPGKGSLRVSGTGNLYNSANAADYEIYGRLSNSNVKVKAPVYTGALKDPEVTVTYAGEKLVLDTDYSLRIIPFDQLGKSGGNVVVTGLGYFSGSVYLTYGESGDVSSLTLRGFSQQYVYSGRFAGPAESAVYAADSEGNQVIPADKLECTFTSSVDKAACVSANATVTITSKATLDDGTVVAGPSATYKIVQRNISSCDIKQLTSDIYTGKALTPPISVSYDRKTYSGTVATGSDVIALVSGRDYSLSYSNNVNPGTAVVTVTGKGNYTGTKRFMFTIKVADMATVTARQSSEGTIVSWTARPHVTGYRVLYNTNGMTKEETSRTTMTLRDAVPTVVGVQAYVKDSAGNITYGTPKYVAVTR